MTKAETARLLTMIAAFDRRTLGETDVEAWHLILGDLEAPDCAAAVREHYTTSRDWIMPADVRAFAVAEQRRREGRIRRAAIEEQIRRETTGEIHTRPVGALTVGQPVPSAADLMRTEVARRRRIPDFESATQADAEEAARREQARLEVEQVRAANRGPND